MNEWKIRSLKNHILCLERQTFVTYHNICSHRDHYQNIHNHVIEFLQSFQQLFQVNFFGDQCRVQRENIIHLIELGSKLKDVINASVIPEELPPNSLILYQYRQRISPNGSFLSNVEFPSLNADSIMKLESQLVQLYKTLLQTFVQSMISAGGEFLSMQTAELRAIIDEYKQEYQSMVELVARYSHLVFHGKKRRTSEFADCVDVGDIGELASGDRDVVERRAQLAHHKVALLKAQNDALAHEIDRLAMGASAEALSAAIDDDIKTSRASVKAFMRENLLGPLRTLVVAYHAFKERSEDEKALESFLECCEASCLMREGFCGDFLEKLTRGSGVDL